jgi:phage gp29-like protein
MMRDDRLSAVIDTRVQGLLGLPFELQPTEEDDELSKRIVEDIDDWWTEAVPESDLAVLYRWYLLLGVAVGELVWTATKSAWRPRLRVHHPQYLWWDETRGIYVLSTKEGMVDVTPGNGKWVLLTDGDRGYMNGLVRSLAFPWLVRQFAIRDWGRYSERHGMPIIVAGVPNVEFADTKDDLVDELRRIATETVIPLPKGAKDEASYTLDLLEATDRTWEGFERLITSQNVSMAIRVLGQNLTTEIQGGSYAAAGIHERILGDIIRGDEAKISTQLHDQVMYPIVGFNYGAAALESTPWPHWDTTPPEDQAKKAETLAALMPALDAMAAADIDTRALLERFGLPLLQESEVQPRTPVPPTPLTIQLADKDRRVSRSLVEGADYADAVQSSVMRKNQMAPTLEAVGKLIDRAGSFDEVRDGVADLYADLPQQGMVRTLQRALILWRLNGRHSVTEEV